jgi:putative PIN family toxin of toxin-antitoxin system
VQLAVIDTGVLVAGIFWRNEPHRCVRAWLKGVIGLVVTDPILTEYERVLKEVKTEQGFSTDLGPWIEALHTQSFHVTPVALSHGICRDPNDDIFIAGALGGDCQLIISRDPDLVEGLTKPFGVEIKTPRAWLNSLSRAERRLLA